MGVCLCMRVCLHVFVHVYDRMVALTEINEMTFSLPM